MMNLTFKLFRPALLRAETNSVHKLVGSRPLAGAELRAFRNNAHGPRNVWWPVVPGIVRVRAQDARRVVLTEKTLRSGQHM